tara:strand:- start:873 stop:1862 length:990 start_codon:yes stop_codon:yes gene_type:complete
MFYKPLVSFIVAVYNGECFIENCLMSIFNQTYKNLEIVIVDDCSYDSTNLIINNLSKNSNIRMIILKNSANLGLTKSLNIAASYANGEWLARLDADDLSKKDRIESQINFAIKNTQYSIIGSSCNFIDEKGKHLFSKYYPSKHKQIKSTLEKAGAFFPHSSVIIRKDVFYKLGGYNNYMKYAQDFELWLRALSKYKIFSINEPLVSIRIHSQRISNHNKGNNQLIYSRACLIAYWLSSDFLINSSIIYSNRNWNKFLNEISIFIESNPYYLGRKSYSKIMREFNLKDFFHILNYIFFNIKNIIFFIITFFINQELFLRKKSVIFKKLFD